MLAPMMAPLFAEVARTGVGSDACLEAGFLPMPVHFYSPLPDLKDLEARNIWERNSSLTGIAFRPEEQLALLAELGQAYGQECNWPATPTGNPLAFYTENRSFSYGCAASTHSILREHKPHRVIEIGSGNSSLVIAAALQKNAMVTGTAAEYTIVDPFPRSIIENGLPGVTRLLKQRVELVDVQLFDCLQDDDVLFIDSGHTIRIGGDVNFLILEVLPRLSASVVVHLHDIPLPYEYPKWYATNPQFRQFWTEGYLLQAFLCLNQRFEVLLAMRYLMTAHRVAFQSAFPRYDPERHQAVSSSFWIRSK